MMGMAMKNGRKSQQGLTLVELMIALAVGAILMLGVVQLFSNMRNAYTLNESLSRIQEAGRFSMAHMSSRMRMAGYMGCERVPASLHYHNVLDSVKSDLLYRFNVPIEAYDYTETGLDGAGFDIDSLEPDVEADAGKWSPTLDSELAGQVIPGSDVFVVRYMDAANIEAAQPGSGSGSGPTFETDGNDFDQDDILFVSDCSGRAVIGQKTNADNNDKVTFGGGQFPALGDPKIINRARTDAFYIGRGSDDQPALHVTRLSDGDTEETQELVSGVESMQLLYGLDTNGNGRADTYKDAAQVAQANQWPNVRTARISLLIRGHRDVNGLPDRNWIDVMGVPFTLNAGEGRQRRVFTTTVQFRNRN